MKRLFHPFGLAHFKAAIAFEARGKFWVGELMPVAAGWHFGRLIK